LNLFTASGLFVASISAVVLWWRRRPHGVLGAPVPLGQLRLSTGLPAILIILGVLLPPLGASMAAVFVLDRFAARGSRRALRCAARPVRSRRLATASAPPAARHLWRFPSLGLIARLACR